MSDATTVYLVPPPTANGPLHLGHLSGPFLAADLAARAARARGERVIALGGVDVHQNYVLTRAENDGVDVHDMIATFRGQIAEAYRGARLREDAAVDPQDAAHQAALGTLLGELVESGVIPMREMTLHRCSDCRRTLHHSYVAGVCATCGSGASGGSCEGCGGFTSAQLLLDARCDRCGGRPVEFTASVPVLDLAAHRDLLTAYWASAMLPPRVRALFTDAQLPVIPLAYPTDWGVEGTGALAGLRIDVYTEVGLSTFHAAARALDPDAADLAADRAAWSRIEGLWHFNGIDNAFYVAIMWPVLYQLLGVRIDQLPGAVINEFFTLDGLKFSTSRNHAIWADEFTAKEDPELIRMFLAWQRPDTAGTDFTLTAFQAFAEWARPLLDGSAGPASTMPLELVEDEIQRGERALRPESFSPAQAVRSLLLAEGRGADTGRLRRVLAGLDD